MNTTQILSNLPHANVVAIFRQIMQLVPIKHMLVQELFKTLEKNSTSFQICIDDDELMNSIVPLFGILSINVEQIFVSQDLQNCWYFNWKRQQSKMLSSLVHFHNANYELSFSESGIMYEGCDYHTKGFTVYESSYDQYVTVRVMQPTH